MFAVVKTGGKQYRVAKDDIIEVEKLDGNAGDKIQLPHVLMVGDGKSVRIGDPLLPGTSVSAEILKQKKADKILVFKKKRRHNYRRLKGHRQQLTVLKILDVGGEKKPASSKAKPAGDKKKETSPKEAAPKKAAAAKAAPKKQTAKTKATKKAASAKSKSKDKS